MTEDELHNGRQPKAKKIIHIRWTDQLKISWLTADDLHDRSQPKSFGFFSFYIRWPDWCNTTWTMEDEQKKFEVTASITASSLECSKIAAVQSYLDA